MTDTTNVFLTSQQLAEQLGISSAGLYKLRFNGGGPVARKIGRSLRFKQSDVDHWLNHKTVDDVASDVADIDFLFTTLELANYLNAPVGTLYEWRSKRRGPAAMKLGRGLRYRKSTVDAWLAAQMDGAK